MVVVGRIPFRSEQVDALGYSVESALCSTHRRSKGRSVQIRKYSPHLPSGRKDLGQEAAFARQMHHDPDVDELSGRHIVDIVM
jgi:hypothetical protein